MSASPPHGTADADAAERQSGLAASVVVGNIVFVSGCTGDETRAGKSGPAEIEHQVRAALDKARLAMEAAGSSMDNIVKTFFLITDLNNYARVRKTETEYYETFAPRLVTNPPAATLMVVPSLAKPEFKAQYEVIGVVDRDMPDWRVTYYPEFWGGRELAYPHVPKEHAKFARSQAVGNLVIVSGCQALDHATVRVETSDFREQSWIVLEKIRIAMEETGGSLGNVVKTNVFIKGIDELRRYREVERAYFQEHAPRLAENPPASTAFIVTELPRPEFLVEVEAFGVADAKAAGWTTTNHPGNADAAGSVAAGNLLFLSGCDGSNPNRADMDTDSIEQQVVTALDKARTALERAGTSMDRVVKTVVMLRHLGDYPKMRATELAYYGRHAPNLAANPPVSSVMQVPAINARGALFQIDVTAVLRAL